MARKKGLFADFAFDKSKPNLAIERRKRQGIEGELSVGVETSLIGGLLRLQRLAWRLLWKITFWSLDSLISLLSFLMMSELH